ncbi:MAG TPA: hypothetical protein VLR90_18565 [Blastocatellia bacterium]|nr:hypothetical protein [Blastocatellia bacterium]
MNKKHLALILALGATFAPPQTVAAQAKKSSVARKVEPLRVINGQMRGRAIEGRFMANGRPSDFSFALSKAEIVGGKLQLIGEFRLGRQARAAETVKASIAGAMAKTTDPWPSASDEEPEKKPEVSEQTQSLYAQAEMATGCGLVFLSLNIPERLRARMGTDARPLQLGVVLAPLDNKLGEDINRRICALVQMSSSKSGETSLTASVEEFNRFLASRR